MRSKGLAAEIIAAKYLQNQGYRIIARNYRCLYGEIDIIAQEKEEICFVEVRSRSRVDFCNPAETVSLSKQRKIIRAAAHYLNKTYAGYEPACRFDVVSILARGRPDLVKNAFQIPAR